MKTKVWYQHNLLQNICDVNGLTVSDWMHYELDDWYVPAESMNLYHALDGNSKVLVVADSDADGLSALGVFDQYMNILRKKYSCYMLGRNDRDFTEFIEAHHNLTNHLVVFLDCGTAIKQEIVDELWNNNCDLVVIDHHQPPETLAKNITILNPQTGDYGLKYLSGAGMTYCVMRELYGDLPSAMQFAAIGTVADVVPIVGLNRQIVKQGCEYMNQAPWPTIKKILTVTKVKYVTETNIAFYIAPALNACARSGQSALAAKVYIYGTEKAKQLEEIVKNQKNGVKEALEQTVLTTFDKCIIGRYEGSGNSYIGLNATKLMHSKGLPVMLLHEVGDEIKCSIRGNGIDVYGFIESLPKLSGGGHAGAGGFAISKDKLQLVSKMFVWYCDANFVPSESYDGDIYVLPSDFEDVVHELKEYIPYGQGFRKPTLVVDAYIVSAKPMYGNHYSVSIRIDNKTYSAVKFNSDYIKVGAAEVLLSVEHENEIKLIVRGIEYVY